MHSDKVVGRRTRAKLGAGLGLLGLLALGFLAGDAAAQSKVMQARAKSRVPGKTVAVKRVVVQPDSMASRFAHLSPVVKPVSENLNLQALKAKATGGKRCGITEVASGVFVRIDCKGYKKVKKAVRHMGPAKLRVLKSRQLAVSSRSSFLRLRAGANKPQAGGGGVQSNAVNVGNDEQIAEDFPSTIDHRALGLSGPIHSQGSVGACTAFALGTTVDNQLRRAGRAEVVSPTHVWSAYGTPDMADAADYNIGKPLAVYDTWKYSQKEACRLSRSPYEECDDYVGVPKNSYRSDSVLMASLQKADSSGKATISMVEELDSPPNLDEIVSAIAGGNDIWSAFYIDGTKWRNSAMSKGVIPDWTAQNGGHAVTLAGYRDSSSGRQFLVHNSWGESWGEKGYAWISEKMVKKHLIYAYRVKIEGAAPVELTDDDCAWDELVDGVTGKCAKICADDSRPANGKCN